MTSIIKRTIDLSIFPINKTVFGVLGEEAKGRKARVVAYWHECENKFPNAKKIINDKIHLRWSRYGKYADAKTSKEDFLGMINEFNHENDVLSLVKQDTLKQDGLIAELFKSDSSDDGTKILLKEIANEQEQKLLLEASFEELTEKGVSWVYFLLETFKIFYLDYLPNYINDKLNASEPVKLEEVKENIKPILTDLFAVLYSSYNKVEEAGDLDQLKTDTETQLEKLKKSIIDYRESKKKPIEPDKPTEDIEALKTKITNLEKTLTDKDAELKELYAYIDGLIERQSQQPVYILTEEPQEIK